MFLCFTKQCSTMYELSDFENHRKRNWLQVIVLWFTWATARWEDSKADCACRTCTCCSRWAVYLILFSFVFLAASLLASILFIKIILSWWIQSPNQDIGKKRKNGLIQSKTSLRAWDRPRRSGQGQQRKAPSLSWRPTGFQGSLEVEVEVETRWAAHPHPADRQPYSDRRWPQLAALQDGHQGIVLKQAADSVAPGIDNGITPDWQIKLPINCEFSVLTSDHTWTCLDGFCTWTRKLSNRIKDICAKILPLVEYMLS